MNLPRQPQTLDTTSKIRERFKQMVPPINRESKNKFIDSTPYNLSSEYMDKVRISEVTSFNENESRGSVTEAQLEYLAGIDFPNIQQSKLQEELNKFNIEEDLKRTIIYFFEIHAEPISKPEKEERVKNLFSKLSRYADKNDKTPDKELTAKKHRELEFLVYNIDRLLKNINDLSYKSPKYKIDINLNDIEFITTPSAAASIVNGRRDWKPYLNAVTTFLTEDQKIIDKSSKDNFRNNFLAKFPNVVDRENFVSIMDEINSKAFKAQSFIDREKAEKDYNDPIFNAIDFSNLNLNKVNAVILRNRDWKQYNEFVSAFLKTDLTINDNSTRDKYRTDAFKKFSPLVERNVKFLLSHLNSMPQLQNGYTDPTKPVKKITQPKPKIVKEGYTKLDGVDF
jgi:hypothetical protein